LEVCVLWTTLPYVKDISIALILVIIPLAAYIIGRYCFKYKFLAAKLPLIPIYYCYAIIVLSLRNDIFPLITNLNTDVIAIGLALLALVFELYTRNNISQTTEALETNASALSEKIETLNKKLNKAEKTLDLFLEESQKLAKRLNALHEEDKNKS
jgi:cell shape-determining protein MreC